MTNMPVLSIITINRNNAAGLKKTLDSISCQDSRLFEHIVVDGASSDESISLIRHYADEIGHSVKWLSEPDNGIYNAMNKGIRMASGEYVQFLNSGDCLAGADVISCMYEALSQNSDPPILYGNMVKLMRDGSGLRDKGFAGRDITFLGLYQGSLNHSPTWIRRDLFDKYGLYDEGLRIVSDWKWFINAIVIGNEKPAYTDIDVTLFDMTGISETNQALNQAERKQVLNELIPSPILSDYDQWASAIFQMRRIKRHPWANRIVWFIERCLFKIEKRQLKRLNTISH